MTKINSQDWIQKTVGKYRIILEISRGRDGVVFLAENEQTKEKAAVKILTSSETPENILESIRKSAGLSHRGLVKIFDYGSLKDFSRVSQSDESSNDYSDRYYIAMEFVGKLGSPGSPFDRQKSMVARNFIEFISGSPQYLSENTVIDLLAQLFDILEYVHGVDGGNSSGIPFGGIFPNNILIEETDSGKLNLKIAEFGIALNPKSNPGIGVFLSSEEIQGHPLDQRSDIYSLGAIAYALITDVPPQSPVVPPSQIRTDILPDWDKLIQQTLTYDPKDRLVNYKKFRKKISKFGKHVNHPWIRPLISGFLTTLIIIGILLVGYFGYKFFEINKDYFRKIGKNTVSKAAKVISSKTKTKAPKPAPVTTNLPETSDLTVAETRKAVSSEQKAVSSEQKAVSSEQKAVSSEQKTVSSEQKTVSSKQKAVSSKQKAVGNEKKAVSSEKKAVDSEQKAMGSEKRAVGSEKKAVSSEQKTVDSEKKTENLKSSKYTIQKGVRDFYKICIRYNERNSYDKRKSNEYSSVVSNYIIIIVASF